ncbi:DUF1788 domain-containing protein [Corynebacterium phoceense]|uniref:DUF1788 domain-containing protein n=1 Tax=Corynebacterium phoceense TaxID=1686286 RepID=UPI001D274C32|nr:DUF1788 domain-containing protein [Corynebacterium phoceense]HJG42478.1 DUF1788 domain-containing protein [Corynebacterium phoceense]
MAPITLDEQETHLFNVMSSERFLNMEGLANEVPFFIYPYEPTDALAVDEIRHRVKNRLSSKGINVTEIDLYELSVEYLQKRGAWDKLIAAEPSLSKPELLELLQNLLNPQDHIAPLIGEKLSGDISDIVFITGVGKVFPYIRSHNVLNNLQSIIKDKPMVMFFPGRYEQSDTQGSALVLFGQLTDDQYYRAKNIMDQEA